MFYSGKSGPKYTGEMIQNLANFVVVLFWEILEHHAFAAYVGVLFWQFCLLTQVSGLASFDNNVSIMHEFLKNYLLIHGTGVSLKTILCPRKLK
jgi:hypothetical protein